MERSSTRNAAFALACTLTVTAAACGGHATHTLTKAQVISQGTAICKQAEREVNALPQVTTQDPFGKGTTAREHENARKFLAGYAVALDHSRTGLANLAAPSDGKPLLDAYLSGIARVSDELRAAASAPAVQVVSQAGKAFALFERVSKNTAQYGFSKGACGSGSSS